MNSTQSPPDIPLVICGPMLRHVDQREITVWFVSSEPCPDVNLALWDESGAPNHRASNVQTMPVGTHAFVHVITVTPQLDLRPGELYCYDLTFAQPQQQTNWHNSKQKLLYKQDRELHFRWQPSISNLLHGSCRKPHHDEPDALVRVDDLIQAERTAQHDNKVPLVHRPDMLFLTGDQVYIDDVAGPMLQAIHQTIDLLGIFSESIEDADIPDASALYTHPNSFYEREQILPHLEVNDELSKILFYAKKKPIFTSVHAQNHLVTFAEVMAMYLLVWSDSLWPFVAFDVSKVPEAHQGKFGHEQTVLECFVKALPRVRRAFAHMPTYMIFDDHDVTDDWNLTRGWEEAVYNNPLSKRMIGNALMGYWLCQGWANCPSKFNNLVTSASQTFTADGLAHHDDFVDELLQFNQWHYQLATQPPIHVLDTRTQRWRSESSLNKPSGLLDWEALCDFQHKIMGQKAVIVVSAAPIYGVKIIEAIQKVFTFFGKALTVDAENWMAHKGTANVILNIFRHYKTPPTFIILSGDVHYSFVYDVKLRFRRSSPRIIQFTCSGIKNAFPSGLLFTLERMNRWFYGSKSILNVFTRRRDMKIKARRPSGQGHRELMNKPAVGQLTLQQDGNKIGCNALCSDGETIEFQQQ